MRNKGEKEEEIDDASLLFPFSFPISPSSLYQLEKGRWREERRSTAPYSLPFPFRRDSSSLPIFGGKRKSFFPPPPLPPLYKKVREMLEVGKGDPSTILFFSFSEYSSLLLPRSQVDALGTRKGVWVIARRIFSFYLSPPLFQLPPLLHFFFRQRVIIGKEAHEQNGKEKRAAVLFSSILSFLPLFPRALFFFSLPSPPLSGESDKKAEKCTEDSWSTTVSPSPPPPLFPFLFLFVNAGRTSPTRKEE